MRKLRIRTSPWSSRSRWMACGLVWGAASAGSLQAQDTATVRRDSLADRLERAEEAISLLQQQLATQAQSSVQAQSRLSVELTGRVLMSAFSNSRRVNNTDVPLFVRPDTASGLPQGGGAMSMRQSTLGVAVMTPQLWGGSFRGDVEVDFSVASNQARGVATSPSCACAQRGPSSSGTIASCSSARNSP